MSEAEKVHLRTINTGKVMSKESIARMVASRKGQRRSLDAIAKTSRSVTVNGVGFISINQAAKTLHASRNTIKRLLQASGGAPVTLVAREDRCWEGRRAMQRTRNAITLR